MFYSHQLLARKAPLGQIWMAATMHAKINRRKLDKLNIIHVCEQILNPSVPMALRLSGILMGGVVIVYERKVKLFYDDVTRLLVEINEAWKVKAAPDPTVLPKGKSQARKEAVTLPEKTEADLRDIEQSLNISHTANMGFQQTAYFAMRLDSVGEPYINNGLSDDDLAQNFHRADAENINLFEPFESYQTSANIFNRFERFDIEGEEETHINFTSGDHVEIPNTLVLSPSPKDETIRADEGQYGENAVNQQSDECKEAALNRQKQRPVKRKTREAPKMDYEQTIIPGQIYQSWLQDASDIASKRGRKRKARNGIMSTMTVTKLLDLPPTVLIDHLYSTENWGVHYPAPLMELWIKSTKPPHDLPSERNSSHLRPELSSLSPPERVPVLDPIENAFEHFGRGLGSEPMGFPLPVEKQRPYPINDEEIFMGELQANLFKNGVRINEVNSVTPGNSGDDVRSIPSLGSGYGALSQRSETNSERSNKKRPFSASSHNGSGLEPVAEENFGKHPEPDFKLSRLSESLTPDIEVLMETGPTQTQNPIISQPVDKITDSIRTQMKNHFETPGAPQEESLNNLAAGMNRKGAALLFYQTCVMASRDFLKVEQKVPYGEILISKGAKM